MKLFKTAIILTLVGILCGALIGFANYITEPIIESNKRKEAMQAYKGFFEDLEDINEKEVSEDSVYSVIEIIKANKVIGYVFKAKGTNPRGLIDLALAMTVEGSVKGVKILDTQNTVGFYDQYNQALDSIGGSLDDVSGIDIIAGVTQSGSLLDKLIKDIKKEASKYLDVVDPDQVYKDMFENFNTKETDTSFVATELVINKEIIKDKDGNEIGYTYTLENIANNIPNHDTAKLTLLVGLDSSNKVLGVQTILSEHTPGFYKLHIERYPALKNRLLAEINYASEYGDEVDGVTGSTASVSSLWIDELIEALKEVVLP